MQGVSQIPIYSHQDVFRSLVLVHVLFVVLVRVRERVVFVLSLGHHSMLELEMLVLEVDFDRVQKRVGYVGRRYLDLVLEDALVLELVKVVETCSDDKAESERENEEKDDERAFGGSRSLLFSSR